MSAFRKASDVRAGMRVAAEDEQGMPTTLTVADVRNSVHGELVIVTDDGAESFVYPCDDIEVVS